MAVDEVSYYEYIGAIMDAERRDKLRRALGPANKASHMRFDVLRPIRVADDIFVVSMPPCNS